MIRFLLVFAFLLVSVRLCSAETEMTSHRTEFDVLFGLLPIGKATFSIEFDDKTYELGAHGRTVGVAELIAPGTGKAKSRGRFTDRGIVADAHQVTYVEKREDKTSLLEMDFKDGAVKDVRLEPDERKSKKSKKWVRITPDQLRDVLDPASTIIVRVEAELANDPHAVCDRRLNVYDGDTRFDIQLNYKATRLVKTDGYDGYAFVCQLRYIPVSGHKRGQRNVNYMRDNEGMEIWLAPMAKTNLYTPIRIEVPTWIGSFSAVPRYFGARKR